jgi:hypothetical protein
LIILLRASQQGWLVSVSGPGTKTKTMEERIATRRD